MSVSSTNNFFRATTFPKELPLAIKIEPQILDHVNFTDPRFVKYYCGHASQEPHFIVDAIQIAETVYETPRRALKDNLGFSYPINPEILGYAMKLARHETVLEVGGKRGENSILFAFSDAKEVYYNEMIPNEIQEFEETKRNLPHYVRVKLKTISGNCLADVPSSLIGKVGMVFCRNFLHLYNDTEQLYLFENLKKVMKPGAKGIFTVNTSVGFPPELYKEDADSTAFFVTQCTLHDNHSPTDLILYQGMSHCNPQLVGSRKAALFFSYYQKKKGQTWEVNESDFKKLPKIVRDNIKINLNNPVLKRIEEGSIKIIHTPIRAYRPDQLSDVFKKQNFKVLHSFAIGDKGHTTSMHQENWDNIHQIGVVVQYLGEGV